MTTAEHQPAARKPNHGWLHLTPGQLIMSLLSLEGFELLSEHFCWFRFNEHKGYAVLITLASLGMSTLLMLGWFAASLLFHWRFQFSIRSLFILVLVVAIPCSWLATETQRARNQREALKLIVSAGGWAKYDDGSEAFEDQLEGPDSPGPVCLRGLLAKDFWTSVVEVDLSGLSVTDGGLEHLKGLTELRTLDIGLVHVTGTGLENLRGMGRLHELNLSFTPLTDAGLENVKALTQLKTLDVRNTYVTDAGLDYLKGLTQLQTLQLKGTKVTDEGVKSLQQALPNCEIEI